jgi:hypothetical protein
MEENFLLSPSLFLLEAIYAWITNVVTIATGDLLLFLIVVLENKNKKTKMYKNEKSIKFINRFTKLSSFTSK